jgi:hypothetical protein
VRLNLLGDKKLDPTLPRVMKWDLEMDNIAGDVSTFVDDLRALGCDKEVVWKISRNISSRFQYLGIQNAPQKWRPPTQKTGAWAGAIFSTSTGRITQTVLQEKWEKERAQIQELSEQLKTDPDLTFDYKRLEQICGFLCHLSMTFKVITRFKGEHNARCHLLLCVPVTGTGQWIRDSVKRLLELKAVQGLTDGPAVLKENGHLFSSRAVDDSMLEVLEDLFVSNQDIFPTKIEKIQDLRKSYQVFRTLQRTLDTQALEMRVSKDDINVVNQWAGMEKAQGHRPGHKMRHYYGDVTLLLRPFKRYTSAM